MVQKLLLRQQQHQHLFPPQHLQRLPQQLRPPRHPTISSIDEGEIHVNSTQLSTSWHKLIQSTGFDFFHDIG